MGWVYGAIQTLSAAFLRIAFANSLCVILLAMVSLETFDTAAKEGDDNQSHCSAEENCTPDEDGEFLCERCIVQFLSDLLVFLVH